MVLGARGSILESFWTNSGFILGPFLLPKCNCFKVVVGVAFGCVLALILVTFWVTSGMIFGIISMIFAELPE